MIFIFCGVLIPILNYIYYNCAGVFAYDENYNLQ
jgi:hypothetical protein